MELLTYADLRTKVEKDLDLETEDFIQSDEMIGYFNEAIDECEAEIHKLGMEDEYFLKKTALPLVQGQEEYDLPTDIYANKIRHVVYKNGTKIFTIKRCRKDKFLKYADYQLSPPTDFYEYFIINPTAGEKPKIVLLPASRETSSTNVTIWHIRNANKLVGDDSVCDIQEFSSFIIKFVKWKVLQKEGHPGQDSAKQELEEQRQLMKETLENMVPDEDSEIPGDYSIYEEMS